MMGRNRLRVLWRSRLRLHGWSRSLARVLVLALPLSSAAAQAQDWRIVHDERADVVVLRYAERFEELRAAGGEPGPVLRLYGDGRATLHRPEYMKESGDYERVLGRAELRRLLQAAARRGALDFDARAVREERERARQAERRGPQAVFFERSEESVTEIEISLLEARAPSGATRRDLRRSLRWEGLRSDARRHPGVRALRDLDAFRVELDALRAAPGWSRVVPGVAGGTP